MAIGKILFRCMVWLRKRKRINFPSYHHRYHKNLCKSAKKICWNYGVILPRIFLLPLHIVACGKTIGDVIFHFFSEWLPIYHNNIYTLYFDCCVSISIFLRLIRKSKNNNSIIFSITLALWLEGMCVLLCSRVILHYA